VSSPRPSADTGAEEVPAADDELCVLLGGDPVRHRPDVDEEPSLSGVLRGVPAAAR
jgi:hypothetical protein